MEEWHLTESDLKKYPHFDPLISAKDAEALATDADRVAKHAFYPFMLYPQRWTRFAEKGNTGKVKKRPIRYAARRDAYIFSYYRHLLSQKYEAELKSLGLDTSVLAYRRIPVADGQGGKCNIHFAHEAISKIRELGDCCVIALDISSYFESLDHIKLKGLWCRMLGVTRLPADHFHVFEAITQYAVVDKEKAYERLGHFGAKRTTNTGKLINGYLTPYNKMPKHLCKGKDFQDTIAGGNGDKTIIRKNYKPFGIPQGAPISDLLANLYLVDFDNIVAGWARDAGGAYYRYSDDILIVVPGNEVKGRSLMMRTRDLIKQFGDKLIIKEEKSSLFVLEPYGDGQKCQLLHGKQGKNGLEYLGFRYDGQRVYLRDATLSNLRRKVTRAAYREATAYARRYPDKNTSQLKALTNYERLIKQFGRVEDFGETQHDYRKWTFWTYATKASEVFGPLGRPILRQLRKHRTSIKHRVDKSLEHAVAQREKRKANGSATKQRIPPILAGPTDHVGNSGVGAAFRVADDHDGAAHGRCRGDGK